MIDKVMGQVVNKAIGNNNVLKTLKDGAKPQTDGNAEEKTKEIMNTTMKLATIAAAKVVSVICPKAAPLVAGFVIKQSPAPAPSITPSLSHSVKPVRKR